MRRRFARGHGERIKLRWRVDPLRTVEQTFNCQNLETRIILIVPKLGCITAGVARFFAHRFARFVKSDQNSARRFLIFHTAEQCRDITTMHDFDDRDIRAVVDELVVGPGRVGPAPCVGESVDLRLAHFAAGLAKENVVVRVRIKRGIEINKIDTRIRELFRVPQLGRLSPK